MMLEAACLPTTTPDRFVVVYIEFRDSTRLNPGYYLVIRPEYRFPDGTHAVNPFHFGQGLIAAGHRLNPATLERLAAVHQRLEFYRPLLRDVLSARNLWLAAKAVAA